MPQSQPMEPTQQGATAQPVGPIDQAPSGRPSEFPRAAGPEHPANNQIFLLGILIAGVPGYILAPADGSAAAVRIFGGVLLAVALVFFLLGGLARLLRATNSGSTIAPASRRPL
jgi:hypothetical protein